MNDMKIAHVTQLVGNYMIGLNLSRRHIYILILSLLYTFRVHFWKLALLVLTDLKNLDFRITYT